ncbi:conserved hypothetical protein [Frankia sp. AiPs1]|uniref:hypothetical protein n=1 Tax=Frankia sp. AiPa1 TaxID=573492 RepID=UPI00202B761F|nr:hypothetical protein [Frankia sp. AiPa1]MCL9762965.1 hypothetical protein [Frankia sp. AiPa1]
MRRLGGGSTAQTAIRILFIVDRVGDAVSGAEEVDGAVRVLRSETKLQKLDFWVRYPDYLAFELLAEAEAGRLDRDWAIGEAALLVEAEVPELHVYPMVRYLRGAYERKDNALALLKSLGHLAIRRRTASVLDPRARRDFYLLEKGAQAVASLRAEIPAVRWYDEQAVRAASFAAHLSGGQCKDRQYRNEVYEGTPLGAVIPPIRPRVLEQLGLLRAAMPV